MAYQISEAPIGASEASPQMSRNGSLLTPCCYIYILRTLLQVVGNIVQKTYDPYNGSKP